MPMIFFKKLINKLNKLISYFISGIEKPVSNPSKNPREIIDKILKIQIEEREEIIRKIDGTSSRVSELSHAQEALIKEKYNIQNKKHQNLSVFNIQKLAYQLELLETKDKMGDIIMFYWETILDQLIMLQQLAWCN